MNGGERCGGEEGIKKNKILLFSCSFLEHPQWHGKSRVCVGPSACAQVWVHVCHTAAAAACPRVSMFVRGHAPVCTALGVLGHMSPEVPMSLDPHVPGSPCPVGFPWDPRAPLCLGARSRPATRRRCRARPRTRRARGVAALLPSATCWPREDKAPLRRPGAFPRGRLTKQHGNLLGMAHFVKKTRSHEVRRWSERRSLLGEEWLVKMGDVDPAGSPRPRLSLSQGTHRTVVCLASITKQQGDTRRDKQTPNYPPGPGGAAQGPWAILVGSGEIEPSLPPSPARPGPGVPAFPSCTGSCAPGKGHRSDTE